MSTDTPEPEEEHPEAVDRTWFDIKKAREAADGLSVMDLSEVEDILRATKNEEILAKSLEMLTRVKENMEGVQKVFVAVDNLLGAREAIAEQQYRTEMALFTRIRQLSKQADAEDLKALADAYSTLRNYGVAPGAYPDDRDSRTDRLTAEKDDD